VSYRYRYFRGADRRRYCWATRPTFKCPLAHDHDHPTPAAAQSAALTEAAELLGCDPARLRSMLHRAHGSYATRRARDDSNRLTDRCAVCGAKLQRLGFARWIAANTAADTSIAAIANRLGDGFVRVEGPWYSPTKTAASEWARSRAGTAEP
jgi:CO/xanthine dehydrogenase Mo-binding subunit